MIPNEGVPGWLLYALIEHQMPWFLSLAADKATTMGHIKRGHLDEPVPILTNSETEVLGVQAQPLWDLDLELRIETQQLVNARDQLLPLLLSGRVSPGEVAA